MFPSSSRARRYGAKLPFSLLAACLGVTTLSGCGGGSGGASRPNPTTPPGGNTLFNDDFDGTSLNASRWDVYDSSRTLQRAQFGSTPQIVNEDNTTFARFNFNTSNPANANLMRGTEIFSRSRFQRGDGLEYEARVRGTNIAPGIIFAAFMIYDRYEGTPSDNTYRKTEIDYEFLGAGDEQLPAPARNFLYLNIWDEWNQPRDGFDGDDGENGTERLRDDKVYRRSVDPNFNWTGWNTYKIRWYADRTEFYVNDRLERTETEVKPQQAMQLHFNIWAASADFNQAYSASLQPTNAANNKNYYFDVDYVRVRSLGSGATAVTGQSLSEIPRRTFAR